MEKKKEMNLDQLISIIRTSSWCYISDNHLYYSLYNSLHLSIPLDENECLRFLESLGRPTYFNHPKNNQYTYSQQNSYHFNNSIYHITTQDNSLLDEPSKTTKEPVNELEDPVTVPSIEHYVLPGIDYFNLRFSK